MNILLVEPDALLARSYRQSLELKEHQVVVAQTAQAAIHAADALLPDVIILELQLVSHSGIEFLYELRSYSEWQDIPVIVHSLVPPGEFRESWAQLRDELGVQTYLYKPQTTLATLATAVNNLAQVTA